MTKGLQLSICEAKKVFPSGTPEAAVCAYVFRQIEQIGAGFDNVKPHDIASALHWTNDAAKRRAVMSALDFLTCGPTPVLERRFELWQPDDTGEVLEEPIRELSVSEMRDALDGKPPIDPSTGKCIPDFLKHVTVIYIVTDLAKKGASDGLSAE